MKTIIILWIIVSGSVRSGRAVDHVEYKGTMEQCEMAAKKLRNTEYGVWARVDAVCTTGGVER